MALRRPLVRFALIFSFPSEGLPRANAQGAPACVDPVADYMGAAEQLWYHHRVTLPARGHQLQAALRLADAEIAALRRRLAAYEPMNRFSTGNALLVTIQETRLLLLRTELYRDQVREELSALERFGAADTPYYEWHAAEALHRLHQVR